MKKGKLFCRIVSGWICVSCGHLQPFHQVKADNPEFIANTLFVPYPDSSYPKFKTLDERVISFDLKIEGE